MCDDILVRIFQGLSTLDKCNIAQINKRLRSVIYSPIFWKNKELRLALDKVHPETVDSLLDRDIRKVCVFRPKDFRKDCAPSHLNYNLKLLINGLFQLESLVLSGKYTDITNDMIYDSLEDRCYTNLCSLTITSCDEIENNAFIKIAECMPNLIELNISHSLKLTNDTLEIILRKLNKLTILKLFRCRRITGESIQIINTHGINIEVLALEYCEIHADAIENISREGLLKLRKFSFGPTDVPDIYVEHLAQTKDRLEYLSLNNKGIGRLMLSRHIIRYMLSLNTLILCTDITDNDVKSLSQMKSLIHLGISHARKITDFGIEHICKNMQQLNALHIIDSFKITNDAVSNISANLGNLKELHLGFCRSITDDALNSIAELKNLEELNLIGSLRLYKATEVKMFDALKKLKIFKYNALDYGRP